jgi:hypothetical protein
MLARAMRVGIRRLSALRRMEVVGQWMSWIGHRLVLKCYHSILSVQARGCVREAFACLCFSLLALNTGIIADSGYHAASPSVAIPEQSSKEDTVTSLVEVENVRILMPLTFPAQVRITVEGQKVDGVPLDVKLGRQGNDIVVTISQTYPRARPSQRVAFKEPLGLEGPFPSGKYTLKVNNYSTTFDI